MSDRYDLVIVGGGAAGFTAGIYAARDRCRALLVERFSPGGQVLNCEHIENFPGFPTGRGLHARTAHAAAGHERAHPNTGFLKELVPLDADGHVITTLDADVRAGVLAAATCGRVRPPARLVGGRRRHRRARGIRYLRTGRWDA